METLLRLGVATASFGDFLADVAGFVGVFKDGDVDRVLFLGLVFIGDGCNGELDLGRFGGESDFFGDFLGDF